MWRLTTESEVDRAAAHAEHTGEPEALWIVDDLSLSLPEAPPEGEMHPEASPVGPFESREQADRWAMAYVRQYGSGSWIVQPLRTPPSTP